ncbi:MAG TPA: hypothetical protein VIY29_21925, partial [Ktedonobacteraceae bacterium]
LVGRLHHLLDDVGLLVELPAEEVLPDLHEKGTPRFPCFRAQWNGPGVVRVERSLVRTSG